MSQRKPPPESSPGKKKQTIPVSPNTPLAAYAAARRVWGERMGTPIVEKNRWFLVSVILALAHLVNSISWTQILPLKTVVPYLMEVDKFSGAINPSSATVASYKPGEREMRYFTAEWVRDLLEIGPTTPNALTKAFSKVRGSAQEEFRDYINKTKVFALMKQDVSLRRSIEISSITFVQERVALVRLIATSRSTRSVTKEERFIVNVNFEIEPPKEEALFLQNPIGFYVTHFDFREELK